MKASTYVVSFLLAVSTATVYANAGKAVQIRQQQQEIRKQSETATGRYARFDETEKRKIYAAQDRVFELLADVNDVSQLDANQQVELFNALETVKAVIAANDADRQVCWREKKLGSHRIQTRCATVREQEQVREGARDWAGESSMCGPGAANATAASCTGRLGQ